VEENEIEISLYNLLFLLLGRKRPKRLEGRGFFHSLPSINGHGTTKVKQTHIHEILIPKKSLKARFHWTWVDSCMSRFLKKWNNSL
jgi:hypothetical protein